MASSHNSALSAADIAALQNLHLRARIIVEGILRGIHKSPYHGFSSEFSEYRQYMTGESVRSIDWKKYAKSDRALTRRYEDETNLSAHILLDKSNSMQFSSSGHISKYEYARTLSAAISYLLIQQRDAAGLWLFDESPRMHLPPKSTRVHLTRVLAHLWESSPGGTTHCGSILDTIAPTLTRRGMCILISDLLDDTDALIRGIRHLHFSRQDIIILQILDPMEHETIFTDTANLKDLETGATLRIDAEIAQRLFSDSLDRHRERLAQICGTLGVTLSTVVTTQPFQQALTDVLRTRTRLY